MTTVTATQCPHGLAQRTCEICRVLEAPATVPGREPSSRLVPRLKTRAGIGLGVGTVLVVVALIVVVLIVVSQVIAVVWSVFHLLQLVAVAGLAGLVGWKAGVVHGRRSRP